MGLGVTASAIMNMLSYTLKDKNINIKLLKYKDQAESFIKSMKNEQFSFEICDTHEELIVDSDVVISTVTYTDEYLSEFKWFKKVLYYYLYMLWDLEMLIIYLIKYI